ncbi:MAG: DUF5602 domain-containing protein [Candidatus Kapabacteria bacterium]|nr:DUF5602 domain-containing protein [Candidatus Kapabacteria bacterium]
MYKLKYIYAAISVAILLLSSCSESTTPTKEGTYYGPKVAIGNGIAQSWVMLDKDGNALSIGLNIDEAALENLPTDMKEFLLALPSEASSTPFNHISVDWNPLGHEPPGIYDVPHFDFHFYMISMDDRMKITVQGDDTLKVYKQPPAGYMPDGYVLPPGTGVPMMGAHAFDVTSPELNGGKFTETFIYGFYDGMMVFAEPMVTVEYLKTKPNINKDLKLPQKYPTSKNYPKKYSIKYYESTKTYSISLDAMYYVL